LNRRNRNAAAGRPAEVTLSRDLNLFTITMIGVGGMIGAGIFVLTGTAAGVAGPALILAFLLNGIVTTITGMAYAELGSAFPRAGGGYVWVKEGLGGAQGFLAGWMDWFAHALAGSLYALGFGRFAAEMWIMAGLPTFGLTVQQMTLGLMTLIVLVFTTVNYRGASETGRVGNIVTLAKIAILGLFVLFGVVAMARTEAWHARFTTGFLPNGLGGVFVAMGLTFIAFEGYEIIAQSGEEVVNPRRNIPRAVFAAIAIAVAIYLYWWASRPSAPPSRPRGCRPRVPGPGQGGGRRRGCPAGHPLWHGRRAPARQRVGVDHVGAERHHLLLLPRLLCHGPRPQPARLLCPRPSPAPHTLLGGGLLRRAHAADSLDPAAGGRRPPRPA
jgi:hypothetical protein